MQNSMYQDFIGIGVIAAIFATYYCQAKGITINEMFGKIADWYRDYGEEQYEEYTGFKF